MHSCNNKKGTDKQRSWLFVLLIFLLQKQYHHRNSIQTTLPSDDEWLDVCIHLEVLAIHGLSGIIDIQYSKMIK